MDGWTIKSWLRLALLPALIYLVQNMCSLLAYQNLDAITYNVLNQTKTLSAALCCYLIMQKKQSPVQMMALLVLLTAALVMEKVLPMDMLAPSYWTDDNTANDESSATIMSSLSPRHFSHGVLPIMVASFLSGLAGAITQKKPSGGQSQRPPIHHRIMRRFHPAPIGILRNERGREANPTTRILRRMDFVYLGADTDE